MGKDIEAANQARVQARRERAEARRVEGSRDPVGGYSTATIATTPWFLPRARSFVCSRILSTRTPTPVAKTSGRAPCSNGVMRTRIQSQTPRTHRLLHLPPVPRIQTQISKNNEIFGI